MNENSIAPEETEEESIEIDKDGVVHASADKEELILTDEEMETVAKRQTIIGNILMEVNEVISKNAKKHQLNNCELEALMSVLVRYDHENRPING